MATHPFGRFFLPGPSEVPPDALAAMAQPMVAHRSDACAAIFDEIQPALRELFGTDRTVFVTASSATGVMEAGARLVPPGRLLALVNGAFSERYARIAERCGHEVERFVVPPGAVHDPAAVRARLDGGDYAALTVAHSETSTGALQPIGEFAGRVPLLVDTVSSLAGAPIDADARGLDFVCSGSQKAIAAPPGLAFAIATDALLGSGSPGRGLYLDLAEYIDRQPPFTPALPLLYALRHRLAAIGREGLAARLARHAAMAARTAAWADERGLAILAPPGARSPTVTCLLAPPGLSGPEIVERIAERGFVIGHGYGDLRATTFRIGHMGEQTLETLEALLSAATEAIFG